MIAHLDADCFYVSAERVRYPHLRGMPLGVLGNHGACIIAKSYEMKSAGVTTGMPIWEAKPKCPHGVYLKRDFQWYEVLSRKMLALIQNISPTVEFYSIDECFFSYGDHLKNAETLQNEIMHDVGVPVSIGIASTKTLAKLISDSAKPFGCGVIANETDRRRLLTGKPVAEITGIANRSALKLARHGIISCDQFADASRVLIRKLLTKTGEELWWELNGTPVKPILITRPEHKFVSRGGSIGAASSDPWRIQAFIVRNAERLVEALNYYRIVCDDLALALLFKGLPERTMRVKMLSSTADIEQIMQAALWMLPRVWRPATAAVHYMHLIAGGLRPIHNRQRSLFEQPTQQAETLATMKRQINQKIGRFALRSGSTLPLADVHGDSANDYDICDIYGKSCF